jgi:hypothetical protein
MVWSDVAERTITARLAASRRPIRQRDIVPRKYRTLQLNQSALKSLLAAARSEKSGRIEDTGVEFQLPMPNGGFHRFLIQESPIMEPKLAARYPEIKTYVGKSVDDPTATVRLDLTPHGFHAIVLSAAGQTYVDPYSRGNDLNYISYATSDFAPTNKPFSCLVDSSPKTATTELTTTATSHPTGASLRTYRLALACTSEYAAAVCSPNTPTVSATLAAMITSVNRVSAIYEREFAIRFVLVDNDDKLIYLDPATDPYTNGNGVIMLGQNQSIIDGAIGDANYDFGHVFSTGGGGIASVAVVCVSGAKARGVTGTANPVGDPYDVDYVAHEMGHQFGANHPFDGTAGSCSGNGNSSTACEPGSGTTIMAYAGICSPQNLATHSDDYFHAINFDEIYNSTSVNNCALSASTGNTPPTVAAVPAYTIPCQTPFALTASATDSNGDTLTYCWEELDKGPFQDPTVDPRDNGSSPLFRSFPPTTNPTRIFPALTYILNNQNTPPATVNGYATAEFLPTTSRAMTFRATVRDNHPGGGGVNYVSTTVTSVNTAGPFAVTSPNTAVTFAGGSQQTVTWNVASTDAAPISCANVKISLSTDGGNTFPIVLASSVPNNGSASVTIPNTANVATTQGRIKVEAVGNIFFDISDANLTITSTNTAPTLNITNSISVVRGKSTPTVAVVGTASDAEGDSVSVAVSNLPFGAHITPSIANGTISLSATVDCSVVTTLSMRVYPITLTVTDQKGSTTSGKVNLIVTPNPSPTLGAYSDVMVALNSSVTATPAASAADANGNLGTTPYSVAPATLPGGGTVTINQSTGTVTASTTASTTLGIITIEVTAVDACGAAAVQAFKLNVVTSISPVLNSGVASAPSYESCSPNNGAVDPGETVTLNFPITNNGAAATNNLVATLLSSSAVTPITTSQNYGSIAAGGSVSRAFQFSAAGSCGGAITATLQLQDGTTNYGVVSYNLQLGTSVLTLWQNFDGVTAPALPSGWTAVVASGSMAPWATSASTADTAPNSVFANTVPSVSDNRLVSPVVALPLNAAQLSFHHQWNLENGFDGGILEISINGGSFTDIIAAGGNFVSGGYNGSIATGYSSPIAGQNAWTGDFNANYTTTVVNLPAAAFGKNVQFRWRLASDSGVSANPATWRIDTIYLTTNTFNCTSCPSTPAILNGPPPSPVVVGSPYSFTFMASGNPAPAFSVKSGVLPAGLTLSVNGVLSGTPTSTGNGNFPNIVIAASNGNSPDAQATFSLTTATRASNYLSSYGLTGANAGLLYDYDHDGIANLLEYALSLNPTVADASRLPVVVIKNYGGTNYLSMTFSRSAVATDLTYTVQASSDLAVWTDLATSVGGAVTSGPGFVVETGSAPNMKVEVRDTVAVNAALNGTRFLRLKVTSF